jgi:type I restriction enzyme S subunit
MQLLEHFNELSLHPKNAKELKGLILELAVQGKLTNKWREENPNIDHASILIERIKKEKEKLEKDKKIRKEKPLPKISKDEEKFVIPESWVWSRLGSIGNIFNGDSVNKSIKETKYEGLENGYPYIATKDVGYSFEPINQNNGVRIPYEEPKFKLAKMGTVLICAEGGSAGKKMGILTEDCCFGNKLFAIQQYGQIDSTYILCLYGSAYFGSSFAEKMSGIIGGISRSNFIELLIPIPPIEEQKAIVVVVNQLFEEVDQLETLTKERIHLKEDFVTSALKQLSTGDTSTEWTFLKEHFSTFFTEKANIKKLRESILQLAVQGKLTSDWRKLNPDVENAKVLLARIKKEKEQLVKEKKIKKENPLPKISDEEIPYELPEGWVWCRLGEIVSLINGDRGKNYPNVNEYVTEGIPWINTGHILPNGTLSERKMNFITEEKFKSLNSGKIQSGDLVYCLRGATFGKTAFVYPFEAGAIASSLVIIRPINIALGNFLYNYLISKTARQQLLRFDNGSAQPNLSANNVKLYLTPLPAHQEQQIIVEKVNSLMALCDELEAAIETSKNTQEKWMESSLREVFEGDKTEY